MSEQPTPSKEELTALLLPYTEVIKAVPKKLKDSLVCVSITSYGGDIHLTIPAFKALFQDWETVDNGCHWTLSAKLNGVKVIAVARNREDIGL